MRTLVYLLFLACLVPLLSFVAFTDLLIGYPKRLKRMHDARQSVSSRQESFLGTPDVPTLPANYRGADHHGSFQGAAEVCGDHGSLAKASWLSNRICG
jgi:hypothetical protein